MKKEKKCMKQKTTKQNRLTNTIKEISEFQTMSKTTETAWRNTAEWFLVS